jgi:hypothetical protein
MIAWGIRSDCQSIVYPSQQSSLETWHEVPKVLVLLAAFAIVAGTMTATSAGRFPAHRDQLERVGSGLLIGGLALLGFLFPVV